jgi:hypothetical protein
MFRSRVNLKTCFVSYTANVETQSKYQRIPQKSHWDECKGNVSLTACLVLERLKRERETREISIFSCLEEHRNREEKTNIGGSYHLFISPLPSEESGMHDHFFNCFHLHSLFFPIKMLFHRLCSIITIYINITNI